MAATIIFYRIPSQEGTRIATIAGTQCTLDQFCKYVIDAEGLDGQDFIIASGTRVFRPSSCRLQSINLQNNSNVDILIPLLGGKGGFGSLLRAIGAQIEKTTNRDACRDLSGRRLRDIKREDDLKKLLELKSKLVEERKLRRKAKLEKLRKRSERSKQSTSIQELVAMFDDQAFNQRRLELGEIIDAAVEKGLLSSKKRQLEEQGQAVTMGKKKSRIDEISEINEPRPVDADDLVAADGPQTDREVLGTEKRLAPRSRSSLKKNDLWLGLDDEEEEEDEDDEQHDAHTANTAN